MYRVFFSYLTNKHWPISKGYYQCGGLSSSCHLPLNRPDM